MFKFDPVPPKNLPQKHDLWNSVDLDGIPAMIAESHSGMICFYRYKDYLEIMPLDSFLKYFKL